MSTSMASRVQWPTGDETELIIATVQIAIPGHQPMSGHLAIPKRDFGKRISFEQVTKDVSDLVESAVMEVRYLMDPDSQVNSAKPTDKE